MPPEGYPPATASFQGDKDELFCFLLLAFKNDKGTIDPFVVVHSQTKHIIVWKLTWRIPFLPKKIRHPIEPEYAEQLCTPCPGYAKGCAYIAFLCNNPRRLTHPLRHDYSRPYVYNNAAAVLTFTNTWTFFQGGQEAKIFDFGVSNCYEVQPCVSPQTQNNHVPLCTSRWWLHFVFLSKG